jgi:hypothetical protein
MCTVFDSFREQAAGAAGGASVATTRPNEDQRWTHINRDLHQDPLWQESMELHWAAASSPGPAPRNGAMRSWRKLRRASGTKVLEGEVKVNTKILAVTAFKPPERRLCPRWSRGEKNKWGVLSRGADVGQLLDRARFYAKSMARSREEMEGVATDDEQAAFWQQGDAALHQRACWRARIALRRDKMIVGELEHWWTMISASYSVPEFGVEASLTFNEYAELQVRLYKALIIPFDESDARSGAREDWRGDASNSGTLERLRVMDSIFELADVWTRHVDPAEYVAFLQKLFGAVTSGEPPRLRHLRTINWADVAGEVEDRVTTERQAKAVEAEAEEEAARAAAAAKKKKASKRVSIGGEGSSIEAPPIETLLERAYAEDPEMVRKVMRRIVMDGSGVASPSPPRHPRSHYKSPRESPRLLLQGSMQQQQQHRQHRQQAQPHEEELVVLRLQASPRRARQVVVVDDGDDGVGTDGGERVQFAAARARLVTPGPRLPKRSGEPSPPPFLPTTDREESSVLPVLRAAREQGARAMPPLMPGFGGHAQQKAAIAAVFGTVSGGCGSPRAATQDRAIVMGSPQTSPPRAARDRAGHGAGAAHGAASSLRSPRKLKLSGL